MSEINFTGIIGGTIAIGRYVVNDYVITITETEGDYGYTMTITKGDEVQTVTLYGLTSEQYTSMLGYLQQALTAATNAQTAAQEALTAAQSASTSASSASTDATTASQAASQAASSASSASQSASAASGSATSAATSASSASASAISAQTAQSGAESAQSAAETAASNASTSANNAAGSASQASQSATNAAGSATAAAQTLTQVQAEGAAQIAAIGAEGERVMESIPADYTALEGEVTELKSAIGDVSESLNYIPLQYTNGYIRTNAATIDINSIVGDAGWTHAVCDCEENDQFTINGNGGGAPLLWAFVDSSGNRLTHSVAAASATDLVIVAPEDAVKLIVNTNDNRISYKGIKPDKRLNDLQVMADAHDAEILSLETALSNANVVAESHLGMQEHFSETLNIPELLSFEKTDCIFHDNFHRANSKTIGQNGTNDYPMEYTDISQNVSESNNMQVGIQDNLAVGFNDYNVTAARRRIKAVNAMQIPYKVKVTFTNTAWIAVGIVDINNYIVINATKKSVSIAPTGDVSVDNVSITYNADIGCAEIYVYKDHVDVAVGGRIILTSSAKITSTLCGIVFRVGNIDILKYSSFSVYLPAQYVDIGYSKTIRESEALVSNRLLGTLQLPNNTYSCLFDYETSRFSKKSLRFDLKYGDTYNNSVRTEIIPPIMRTPTFGLQTQIFEFDILFPNDYLIDDSEDCIYQAHHTEDGINASGANPNICLYVKNDHMYLWINGAEDKIAEASEAVSMTYDLGTIDKGNWHRYTLAFRQGYSLNYNPYTALYVDGTLKIFSNDLNMYNSPYSSYSKFGIYKWDWKSGPTQTNERVIYFANVNVWQ